MMARVFVTGVLVFLLMAYMEYASVVNDYVIHVLWWWDIPMHILGGAWAGLIALWFVLNAHQRPSWHACVGFALLCGVAIEILEYYSGLGRSIFMSYPLDTAKDLIMDLIGGYLAWRYFLYIKKV